MKALASAILLGALIANAQSYTIVPFDAPDSTGTVANGINSLGQIVGTYLDAAGNGGAFLRSADGKTFTTIDVPGSAPHSTTANGINNLGQIVGSYFDSTGRRHGYIRSAAGDFTLFDITCQITDDYVAAGDASSINDQGEVVGPCSTSGTNNGYLRQPDGSLVTIAAPFFAYTIPLAINNLGQIAGSGLMGNIVLGTRHGFVRSPSGTYVQFDLPGVSGATQLSAFNNVGQLAGSSFAAGFVSNADGTVTLLNGYPVSGINDSGQIVGGYTETTGTTTFRYRGFLGVPGPASTQPAIRTALPGVQSASAFGGRDTIAPGIWIEIYGQNLAPTTRQWRDSDFIGNAAPTSLDGVSVSISGSQAYISYISPGQINALVPSTVMPGMATVTVTNGSLTSNAYSITVEDFQPAVLMVPPTTNPFSTFIAALFPDFATYALPASYTNVPTRAAKPGDTIILFGMGFGAVAPEVPTGTISTQASLVIATVEVYFNANGSQLPGKILYAGTVPGTVGLYQLNILVPADLPGGNPTISISVNSRPVANPELYLFAGN